MLKLINLDCRYFAVHRSPRPVCLHFRVHLQQWSLHLVCLWLTKETRPLLCTKLEDKLPLSAVAFIVFGFQMKTAIRVLCLMSINSRWTAALTQAPAPSRVSPWAQHTPLTSAQMTLSLLLWARRSSRVSLSWPRMSTLEGPCLLLLLFPLSK